MRAVRAQADRRARTFSVARSTLSKTVCLMLSPPAYLASASAKKEPFIASPMPCVVGVVGGVRVRA